jgi:hypothetical protein
LVWSAVTVRVCGGQLMRVRATDDLPVQLKKTLLRFENWRRTRRGRSRIPKGLWASAVRAAGQYGLHQTARALRLDYSVLRKRLEAAGLSRKQASRSTSDRLVPAKARTVAGFVELAPPVPVASPECILELESAAGAKMRIHLKGFESPDVAALSQGFWSIEG